jgi:hypothetical protein
MNDNVHPIFRDYLHSVFAPNLPKSKDVCGVTGKEVPPEDLGGCNNAEFCDQCPHNEEEE